MFKINNNNKKGGYKNIFEITFNILFYFFKS